ncbi:MAG: hypothetical protein ACLTQI_07615 [Slackia sp.]
MRTACPTRALQLPGRRRLRFVVHSELYADFGFGGIVWKLYSGRGVPHSLHADGRGWFGGMVALTAALAVFHMPRGAYIECIDFIIETRFLRRFLLSSLSVILAYVSRAGLLPKRIVSKGLEQMDEPSVMCAVERAVPLVEHRAECNGAHENRHGILVSQASFTRVK